MNKEQYDLISSIPNILLKINKSLSDAYREIEELRENMHLMLTIIEKHEKRLDKLEQKSSQISNL